MCFKKPVFSTGHISVLLITILWGIIIADIKGLIQVLDPAYKSSGFCISTKENQGFNSFELCFYFDLCGAALIFLAVNTVGRVG